MLQIVVIGRADIEFLDVLLDHFVRIVPEQLLDRGSRPLNMTINVCLVNNILHAVKDGAHALL